MPIEIKNRFTGKVICTGETVRDAALANLADLRGADLRGAKLAWQSHDLLSELLRRAAGDDIEKLKVAGLLLVCREKYWKEFVAMRDSEPLFDWAIEELAKWVQPDDGAPEILRELVTPGD